MHFLPPACAVVRKPTRTNKRLATPIVFILLLLVVWRVETLAQGSGRSSQGTGGNHVVTGFVFFPSGRRAEGPIQVKLQTSDAGEISLITDSSGSFTFTALAPGNYTVVIDAGKDYEIVRERVFIDTDVNTSRMGIPSSKASRRFTVMVHLQPKREVRQRAGVLNAALAAVPENARKLYERGIVESRAGETAKAVDSLKEAIALYPTFALALNELGVQYLKLGKTEKAVEALKTAITLDSDSFSPRLNLGIALLEDRKYSEAQTQLDEAIKRNATAPLPHLYLGVVLAQLSKIDEAEQELLRAIEMGGGRIPQAHYYLGGLYWKKRDYAQAVDQLEKYLQLAPNAADAARVRTTIKDLRSKM